jgi:hypothetical protein
VHLRVEDLHISDRARDKLASHGVPLRAVHQVLYGRPKYCKNKKNRAASYLMIGPDRGGAMWAIAIRESDYQLGLWDVITGWPAEDKDKEWYGRS